MKKIIFIFCALLMVVAHVRAAVSSEETAALPTQNTSEAEAVTREKNRRRAQVSPVSHEEAVRRAQNMRKDRTSESASLLMFGLPQDIIFEGRGLNVILYVNMEEKDVFSSIETIFKKSYVRAQPEEWSWLEKAHGDSFKKVVDETAKRIGRNDIMVLPVRQAMVAYSPPLFGMAPVTILSQNKFKILMVSKSMNIETFLKLYPKHKRLSTEGERALFAAHSILIEDWFSKHAILREFVEPVGITEE